MTKIGGASPSLIRTVWYSPLAPLLSLPLISLLFSPWLLFVGDGRLSSSEMRPTRSEDVGGGGGRDLGGPRVANAVE